MFRIIKWLLFGVACSLLPIFFGMIQYVTSGADFTLANLIGKGELLIISTAVAATGFGELVTEAPRRSIGIIFTGFSSFALTAISAYWFSDITSAATVNIENVKNGSLIIFGMSILSTLICFKQTEVPSWRI